MNFLFSKNWFGHFFTDQENFSTNLLLTLINNWKKLRFSPKKKKQLFGFSEMLTLKKRQNFFRANFLNLWNASECLFLDVHHKRIHGGRFRESHQQYSSTIWKILDRTVVHFPPGLGSREYNVAKFITPAFGWIWSP